MKTNLKLKRLKKRIYLSPPCMGSEERKLLLKAFDSNWIAPLGPYVDAFEREFAKKVNVPYTVALSSGTAGIHLALRLIGCSQGDEVLVSTFTFAATANAITYLGAVPVFIDSDIKTWNMDPNLLADELNSCKKKGKLPSAVIVVDLYGQCADFDPIIEVCSKYGIPVIEDAAEALGATYKRQSAGSLGMLGIFSFNGNKIITTSGGGMLVSNRKELIEKVRFWATQARDPAPHYQHSEIGYNYRLSNLLAAIGLGQLKVLDKYIKKRRRNNELYRKLLADIKGIKFMPVASYGIPNYWLTCITIDENKFGAGREDIRLCLESLNIESRPLWKPMHLQPIFSNCRIRDGKISATLFEKGLCLPSGSNLSEEEVILITDIIKSFYNPRFQNLKANRSNM